LEIGETIEEDCGHCTNCDPHHSSQGSSIITNQNYCYQSTTPGGQIVYGLAHRDADEYFDIDLVKSMLISFTDVSNPPEWCLAYIPGHDNQEVATHLGEVLNLPVYCFLNSNSGAGSVKNANTSTRRQEILQKKFSYKIGTFVPSNVLLYDDCHEIR